MVKPSDDIKKEAVEMMQECFTAENINEFDGQDGKTKMNSLVSKMEERDAKWKEFVEKYRKASNPLGRWLYVEMGNHFRRLTKSAK